MRLQSIDKKTFLKHISMYEMEAERVSYLYNNLENTVLLISRVQSICDFNLFFMFSLESDVVGIDTIRFLNDNISKFKRKITKEEIIKYDYIINNINVSDFEDFKKHAGKKDVYKSVFNYYNSLLIDAKHVLEQLEKST